MSFLILFFVYLFYNQILLFYLHYEITNSFLIFKDGYSLEFLIKINLNNNSFSENFDNKESLKVPNSINKLPPSLDTNITKKTLPAPILTKPAETLEELKERKRSLLNDRWPFPRPIHPDDKKIVSTFNMPLKNFWLDNKKEISKYEKELDNFLKFQQQFPQLPVLKPNEILTPEELDAFNIFKERHDKKLAIDQYMNLYNKEIPLLKKWIKLKTASEEYNKLIWDKTHYFFKIAFFGVILAIVLKPFKNIIFFPRVWNLRCNELLISFNYYIKNKKRNELFTKRALACINQLEVFKQLDLMKLENVKDWESLLKELSSFIIFCRENKIIMQDVSNGQFVLYEQLMSFIPYTSRLPIYIKFFKKWFIFIWFPIQFIKIRFKNKNISDKTAEIEKKKDHQFDEFKSEKENKI